MSDEYDYSLLMPFVTVTSKGGPHEDNAYTAGWEMGKLTAELAVCALHEATPRPMVLRLDNREQADLIAMNHGYTMVVNIYDDQFWMSVEFTRADPQVTTTKETP